MRSKSSMLLMCMRILLMHIRRCENLGLVPMLHYMLYHFPEQSKDTISDMIPTQLADVPSRYEQQAHTIPETVPAS